MNSRRLNARPLGYTLIEMVVASLGASILIAGLSSSLFVAMRATDTSQTPTLSRIQANAALLEMQADLEFALAFSEETATAMTFTVPDRDGDLLGETIRYAWSGKPGDPLTRQINGGTVATLVEDVHVFQHDLPSASPNLLSNPDMEAGTMNWEAISGATLNSSTTPVYQGSLSLTAARNSSSSESGLRQNVMSQLVNGTPYQLSAWLRKTDSTAPYHVRLQLRINSTGNGQQVFAADPVAINNSRFRLVKGKVTPSWSGTLQSAYWELTGIDKIQEIHVDDAEFRARFTEDQSVNLLLQVGPDSQAQMSSGVRLLNSPL